MNRAILTLFFFFSSFAVNAQSTVQKADTAFRYKEFTHAIELYNKSLKKGAGTETKRIYFQLGECYRFENNFREAAKWYDLALETGFKNPALLFNHGEMLIMSGNYFGAKNSFQQFLKTNPDDARAKLRLESCEFALQNQNYQSKYAIKNEGEINTEASEYGTLLFKDDRLYFASTRVENNMARYDSYTGQGFSDFYEARKDGNKWGNVKKLKGLVNTDYNDGTFTYDPKTKIGYFMQCNGATGKKENCNIFLSIYNERDNTWSNTQIFGYNNKDFSVGHPSLSKDGNTMYFVSDMPGGKGGKDIWKVLKLGDNVWSDPINLGDPINTVDNEMFPLILGDTALYFASDGHVGYGGLDIFKSKIQDKSFSKPENMLSPFNSSADDFSITFFEKGDGGFFCSNRIDGKGNDDIYSFFFAPLELTATGKVTDQKTGKPLQKVKLTLFTTDGTKMTTEPEDDGTFKFKGLKKNTVYTLTATKDGYFNDKKQFETEDDKVSHEYSKEFGYDLDFSLLKIQTTEEINIPNIYYDFDSAVLKDESRGSLNKLVTLLKETPNVRVSLNSHTDEQGTDEYNMGLSQRRAQVVVDYLISNGIAGDRLEAKGFGESMPVMKGATTEEGHALNRRTTLKVISK